MDAAPPWLMECAALFIAPFAHEDIALLGAALLIVERQMPAPLALTSVYGGVIASDLFLFGLGRLARHSGLLRHRLVGVRVETVGAWLDAHLVRIVMLSRLVPGLLFPAFVACGWFGVPFRRFIVIAAAAAAIYTPLVLFLAVEFGELVLQRFGDWAWAPAFAVIVALVLLRLKKPGWETLDHAITGRPALHAPSLHGLRRAALAYSHRGMPALGRLRRKVSLAERIPPPLFYLPLVLQWLVLGLRYRSMTLPTVANPLVVMGGMWGESKSDHLGQIAADQAAWVADFVTLVRAADGATADDDLRRGLRAMAEVGLDFPVVAKPDIGWRGFGVRRLADAGELRDYLTEYPPGETMMLQRLIPYDGEAGILYFRFPGDKAGIILSLTLRYFPHVVGDGRSTVRELILRDQRSRWKAAAHLGRDPRHRGMTRADLDRIPPAGEILRLAFIGSNRVGGLYRDGEKYLTPELAARIDAISRSIPEFHFGRYDIRFKSIERLQQGADFAIIEINGAGAESINVWDPEMPVRRVYAKLFRQQALLFRIAAQSRARGFAPVSLRAFFRYQRRQSRLIRRYPASG